MENNETLDKLEKALQIAELEFLKDKASKDAVLVVQDEDGNIKNVKASDLLERVLKAS